MLNPFFHEVQDDYDYPNIVIIEEHSFKEYYAVYASQAKISSDDVVNSEDVESIEVANIRLHDDDNETKIISSLLRIPTFAEMCSRKLRNRSDDGTNIQTLDSYSNSVSQSMDYTDYVTFPENHIPFEIESGVSQYGDDETVGKNRATADSASTKRKQLEHQFEAAARRNIDLAEALFKKFPDIKLGKKKEHARNYFDKDNVKFALLVLAESNKFREFKDKALSVVTKTVESALRVVDGNGVFTKKELEKMLIAMENCNVNEDIREKIRCRINEWKKKLKQADKAYTRRPQDFEMDKVFDDVVNLSDNVDDIISLYKETVPARLHWIQKERATVMNALQKFPHYKSYSKLLVDIDFSHITKWKPPKIANIGDFFRSQQHALIALALNGKLITLKESTAFEVAVTALLTLPRVIEYYGKRSPKAKSCNIFVPKANATDLESAKSAVLRDQKHHAFITCATVDTKLTFAVVIENTTFTVDGDAFEALDVFIKFHYSFNIEPSDDYKFLYEFIKAIMFDKKKPMHMKFLSNLEITNDDKLNVITPRSAEVKPSESELPHPSVSKPSQSQPFRNQFKINPVKGKHPLLYSNPNVALLQQKCNDVRIDWICSYQVPTEPKLLQDCQTITTLDVASDGHCGFSSVSMLLSGVPTNYMAVREVVGQAIVAGTFEKAKEFYEFSSPGSSMTERKRTLAAKTVGKMYAEDALSPEMWLDSTDSLALALHLQMNIVVYDDSQRVWTVWNETTMPNPSEARILEHLPSILLFLKNDHYMPIINVE